MDSKIEVKIIENRSDARRWITEQGEMRYHLNIIIKLLDSLMIQEIIKGESFNYKQEIWSWVKILVTSSLIAIIITTFFKPTLVIGNSMYPTLGNYNYILINRAIYWNSMPKAQDIVVFKSQLKDEKILIKRVIAVAGDSLKIRDSKVFVNGVQLDEPYIHRQLTTGTIDTVIPEGHVFVMGDNRGDSLDSRFKEVGYVNKQDVVGKTICSLLPLSFAIK